MQEVLNRFKKWGITLSDVEKAVVYLKKYKYLGENFKLDEFIRAIKNFQQEFGLKNDGELGPKTSTALDWPRCGCADAYTEFAERISKWGTNKLTYYIKRRDNDLRSEVWDNIISEAFESWSGVAELHFTKVLSNKANLIIDVGSGRADNFDGPGKVLAWAYLPASANYRGQLLMKFDAGENWVVQGNGIKLKNVAAHEIGHLLGLVHSNKRMALMAPFYNPDISSPQQDDDIERIQKLYGEPVKPDEPDEPNKTEKLEIELEGKNIKINKISGYRVTKLG